MFRAKIPGLCKRIYQVGQAILFCNSRRLVPKSFLPSYSTVQYIHVCFLLLPAFKYEEDCAAPDVEVERCQPAHWTNEKKRGAVSPSQDVTTQLRFPAPAPPFWWHLPRKGRGERSVEPMQHRRHPTKLFSRLHIFFPFLIGCLADKSCSVSCVICFLNVLK